METFRKQFILADIFTSEKVGSQREAGTFEAEKWLKIF